jgi:hypothetical protein
MVSELGAHVIRDCPFDRCRRWSMSVVFAVDVTTGFIFGEVGARTDEAMGERGPGAGQYVVSSSASPLTTLDEPASIMQRNTCERGLSAAKEAIGKDNCPKDRKTACTSHAELGRQIGRSDEQNSLDLITTVVRTSIIMLRLQARAFPITLT